ncbi:MAG: c-type cytochrome [Pseudomonadota bacterium]
MLNAGFAGRFCAVVLFAFLGVASPASVSLAAEPAKDAEAGEDKKARSDPLTAASNPLSGIGRSGFRVYHHHCESCHGYLGEGSRKAPALAGTAYATDYKSRRDFHTRFRTSSSKHARVARGTRKKPGPRFNELEMVAKFLREVEVWRKTVSQAGDG